MLTNLHISSLAVLDQIELDLLTGFTALTGETGAGKSLLVDALALALGARADSGVVRSGAERTEITATFNLDGAAELADWLKENDLDTDEECQLRRVVTREGRSRGYVNGRPVPMETLREAGSRLVEICGQHAHQSLRHKAAHRDLLDAHAGNDALLTVAAQAYRKWQAMAAEHRILLDTQRDRMERRDLLDYQLQELTALNLGEGEIEALEREHLLLANSQRLASGISLALERLYDADDASAHDMAGSAEREITSLTAVDPDLIAAADALAQARISITDAVERLRSRLQAIEHDPSRQDEVENRLAAAQDLARKHRTTANKLWQCREQLAEELARIDASAGRATHITRELEREATRFREASHQLSQARGTAAGTLAELVRENLKRLGMSDCRFEIRVTQVDDKQAGPAGQDQVEFLVATNPGQEPGPISRIASGGELSRLSLAIQVVAMARSGVSTLVFDEVDAGIGGSVAQIVGESLKRLSQHRQVLCVTHLAQVASQADHHYAVRKMSGKQSASTVLVRLQEDERIEEIARMLGGIRITERTRAHAREMCTNKRPRRAS